MTVLWIVLGVLAALWLVQRSLLFISPRVHRRRRDRNDAVFFSDCRRPFGNHFFRKLPSPPRCALCYAPFGGMGRVLMIKPSRKNPKFCDACFERAPMGGHEIDIGVLMADVRGFTALAEHRQPEEVASLLNRLYHDTTEVLIRHDAIIDKLVGDEVMALFIPEFPNLGDRTCDVMVTAAEDLLRATGDVSGFEPWVKIGIGLTYGPAFVGNVGGSEVVKDFTAIGDVVNTAQRLQASAAAGEVVISEGVYERLASRYLEVPTETLAVKGRDDVVAVRRLRPLLVQQR